MTTHIYLKTAKIGDKFVTRDGEVVTLERIGKHATHKFVFTNGEGVASVYSMDDYGRNLCNRKKDLVSAKQCPSHYNNSWAVGNFIRDQQLNFHLGNAIKYICRCDKKGQKIEDLKKAIHYLNNELEHETQRASKGVQDDFPGDEYFEWSSLPDH